MYNVHVYRYDYKIGVILHIAIVNNRLINLMKISDMKDR